MAQLDRLVAAGLPARWAAFDEVYGRSEQLRRKTARAGLAYAAIIPCDYLVRTPAGTTIRADAAVAGAVFERRSCGPGSKGPRYSDWAMTATAVPGQCLLIRRLISRPEQYTFYLCWAPPDRPATMTYFITIAGRRWHVEETFKTGKDILGWDQSQTRNFTGICRHTALAALANWSGSASPLLGYTSPKASSSRAAGPPTSKASPIEPGFGGVGLRSTYDPLHLQLDQLEQLDQLRGSAMTDLLIRDAAALHRALAEPGSEVNVALARETAELVSRLVDARARGEEIVVSPANAEVSPTEAAVLLAMSRPQVRKLMDRGLLESRKVGTHHRIRVSSIRAFLETERERRREAMDELAAVQNELGLTG